MKLELIIDLSIFLKLYLYFSARYQLRFSQRLKVYLSHEIIYLGDLQFFLDLWYLIWNYGLQI